MLENDLRSCEKTDGDPLREMAGSRRGLGLRVWSVLLVSEQHKNGVLGYCDPGYA